MFVRNIRLLVGTMACKYLLSILFPLAMKSSDINENCWEQVFVSFSFVLLWKSSEIPKASTILKERNIGLGDSDAVFCLLLPLLLMALEHQAGVYNFQAATTSWGKPVRTMLKMRKPFFPAEHLNFLHCLYFWDRWWNIIAPNIAMTGECDKVRERRSLFLLLFALHPWLWKSHLHSGGGRYCVSPSISWHLP